MATEYRQRPGMGDHFDDEDLVMSSAQQRRNWRGILIALMVIVAVLAMIVTSVVLLTPPQPEELMDSYSDLSNGDRDSSDYYYNQRAYDELWWRRRGMRTLRLSDVLTDSASIKTFNGTWISGNEVFYVTGSGSLAIMEITADAMIQTTRHLMSKQMLQKLKGPLISFELSPDRAHVLIGHDAKKLFRYSKTAKYTVYTVSTGQMTPVMLDDNKHWNGTTFSNSQPYLLHAQWHKISTAVEKNIESMALIIVYRYDIFYVPWSLNGSVEVTDTVSGKNNLTMDNSGVFNHAVNLSKTPLYPSKDHVNSTSLNPLEKPWPHGPVRRITTSGYGLSGYAMGTVSNGVADYLYETEILKRSPAVWPSSGRYLMYATFDDHRVGEYKYSVYMKDGRQQDAENDKKSKNHVQQQKPQRKKKRRRRRIRRDATSKPSTASETSEYYLYPKIRTIKYPKTNTPNPIITLSMIVNLDQLGNPRVQPKIRILTPPPTFQYTDDYYFTAVQWVNDGGVGGRAGSFETNEDKSGASAAEICVVWLNRAQNISVTTLCKSPMWMCQETQVINAVGAGFNGDGSVSGGGQASGLFGGDRARRRFRRNQNNIPQKTPPETIVKTVNNDKNTNVSSLFGRENQYHRRQPHQRQHQYNGHHNRRRRSGDFGGGATTRRQYGGWVDAAVGGAGGGVPSTGGDLDAVSTAVWWSTADTTSEDDGTENFAGDDGYAGIAGVGGAATGAGYIMAALTRRGWETGDKELAPRVPVFAADGQGYVSVAPVRNDDAYGTDADDQHRDGGEGGVRLRRPSSTKQNAHAQNATNGPSSVRPPVSKYYAQVVAVNITKKLLTPLTFGEPDNSIGDSDDKDQKKKNVITKSWMVVRILAWDQRTDLIYFLAVPSGRGAPHYRHLYAVKFTSPAYSWTATSQSSSRSGHHYQQQYKKTIHHSARNLPTCLSCDIGSIDNTLRRDRRDVGGKQNRMDEARDDRLRQQHRERWQHQKEEEEADKKEQAATAEEEDERSQQQNRQRKHKEIQNRGTRRHCTYYDAQFSRDGSHYALICLGPSVPYVTLHRTMAADSYDDIENNDNDSGSGVMDNTQHITQKSPTNNSSYTFEFIALIENNTRLQDKYTNRVLLPDTRTFQLRLSGGRKLTTSGGLHFNDPLAAADYYSNGGGQQLHFSARKRTDSDPLTVAQVRLYLPLSVYDPEADPRPEFMTNYVTSSGGSVNHAHQTIPKVAHNTNHNSLFTQRRRRRRSSSSSSSSHDNKNDNDYELKRQRRPYKQQRKRRYKKLYPMLVVLNSDPGSQAITDRFIDRLGYTTGLLCSGSLGRTMTSTGGGTASSSKYNENKWNRRRNKERRNRRSATTWYYSSSNLENDYDNSHDYEQYDDEDTNNNEYVIAVIDPGRGTWARGYESLMALNYNVGNDRYEDNSNKEENESGGLLGTADIRDQMEAVEYLLSSATTTDENYKDTGQGYYSEDRPRGGRGSRDRSRWFSSSSQSNRRYFSDDDDYYNNESEYSDNNDKNYDDDYYYYYYSNGGDNSDYGGGRREDSVHRDGNEKRGRRDRRSTSDTKSNSEALRLPYVDATRVALLGGGPTSPSAPSSIYGGYAAARMALWQSNYGGAPIEKNVDEVGNDENRKEPVAIHSSFKCAITMAPVYSWRLYASAFAERYFGYYGKNDGDNWISYDRSDLIPLIVPINGSSFSPSSNGKGINLLVMHGTADTSIHPQHSMMLVRGVMQQQQQYTPNGIGGNHGRRNNNSTTSGGRISNGLPFKVGAIRISQLALPDVDLSNMRMVTGVEHGSPIHYQHQLLHSIYSHITQYLATECFTSVLDGRRGRGIRVRGRALRKRRRRRWRTGNRDQEDLDDQQQQLQRDEYRQQYQKNQLSVSYNDNISGSNSRTHNNGGRYRRHNIDDSHIIKNKKKNDINNVKIKTDDYSNNNNNESNSVNWNNNYLSTLSSNNNNKSNKISKKKTQQKNDYVEEKDEEIENDDGNNNDYKNKKNYKEKDKN